MSDGREERAEQEARRKWQSEQDSQESRYDRERRQSEGLARREWEPERRDS
ncbi:MAG: hypothetical protein KGK08_04855 [Acidobacteriota bacterium]|nr:hypothetical protein [Acidobacteriota bacterium]